jgi:ribonuclease P protein component
MPKRTYQPNSLRFVYQHGATVRGSSFAIKSVLNPRRKSYRLAIVISRKVHKSAVARNRMRRRLYAIIQEYEERLNRPYDIVITVFNDSLLEEPHKSLSYQVKRQLQQAGVLDKP